MTPEDDRNSKVLVAPSLLSADFMRLSEELQAIEAAGADLLHLDIMDGHFVPNITFGPGLVKAIRKATKLALDVHLMIDNPELYIPRFIDAGADFLTVHYEASTHLHRNIYAIKNLNVKAGVSLNPHSPISFLEEVLGDADLVLLMSVNPGFGGQTFIDRTVDKIRAARKLIDEKKYACRIEVDGGINAETGRRCAEAGVDILVAGNYIFYSSDYRAAIESLRK